MLFNILSYMNHKLLTCGNTVASIDELYLFLTNLTAIEYIRNASKRVRKKESAIILASQNIEDFLIDGIREYTNVPFHYNQFLGYRKGIDGKPEIVPEEAETIRMIYDKYLTGDSIAKIAGDLNTLQFATPSGKGTWHNRTVQSILTNEKYKGDAILNKTYITDCISKKEKVNNH